MSAKIHRANKTFHGAAFHRDDPITRVLDAFRASGHDLKPQGGGWRTRCPAHPDRKPSLDISVGSKRRDGTVVLHCFASCRCEAILSAVGLQMSDLFPSSDARSRRVQVERGPKARPTLAEAITAAAETLGGREAGRWTYLRPDHSPFCELVRFEIDEGGKQFRPLSQRDDGRWRMRIPKGRRPLYHLAQTTGAETVFVVEGEKCADALTDLGLVAVTSLNGAGSTHRTDWDPLKGKRVVILPDNDVAGDSYAEAVAAILRRHRPRSSVVVLKLPGLAHKEDVADWLDPRLGYIPDSWEPEMVRAELLRLAAESVTVSDAPRLKLHSPLLVEPEVDQLTKKICCIAWLRERLADGPVPSSVLEAEAKSRGFGKSTLQESKQVAGVESQRIPLGRGWQYALVGDRGGPASLKVLPKMLPKVSERTVRNKGKHSYIIEGMGE